MAIKPILFNAEMVRAIMDGRKSCTRRLVKFLSGENPRWTGYIKDGLMLYNGKNEPCIRKAPYQPGDILYVRETWHKYIKRVGEGKSCHLAEFYGYKASIANSEDADEPWKPSIHMPKEAARIWLKVTNVRLERLQDITEDGAEAEGAIDNRGFIHSPENEYDRIYTAREHFIEIWDRTIKKSDLDIYGWDANPWVWVIEFERCEPLEV
ncbi:MAG: hypothetical protein V8Q86_12155 [Blautia sp.]